MDGNDEKLRYFRIQRGIHALRQGRRWHDYDGGIRGRHAVSRSKTIRWVICSSRISNTFRMHPSEYPEQQWIKRTLIHFFQRQNCAIWWMKWIKTETVPSSLMNFCRWCRRRWKAPTEKTNFARRSGNKFSTIHKNSKYLIASKTITLKERPEATFVHGKNRAFKGWQERRDF